MLTFGPSTPSRQCANVPILLNDILEGDELFLAQLIPMDGDTVIMDPSMSTVIITDQDSEYMRYWKLEV